MEFAPLKGDSEAITPAKEPTMTVPRSESSWAELIRSRGHLCGAYRDCLPFFDNNPGTSRSELRVKDVPSEGR